jgi:hypothetical protein
VNSESSDAATAASLGRSQFAYHFAAAGEATGVGRTQEFLRVAVDPM